MAEVSFVHRNCLSKHKSECILAVEKKKKVKNKYIHKLLCSSQLYTLLCVNI